MSPSTVPGLSLVIVSSPEHIAELDAVEERRRREARVDAMGIDRSRFAGDLLDQASRQMMTGYADEEAAIARRRARSADVSHVDAMRQLTAKPGLWRRIVWGER